MIGWCIDCFENISNDDVNKMLSIWLILLLISYCMLLIKWVLRLNNVDNVWFIIEHKKWFLFSPDL